MELILLYPKIRDQLNLTTFLIKKVNFLNCVWMTEANNIPKEAAGNKKEDTKGRQSIYNERRAKNKKQFLDLVFL